MVPNHYEIDRGTLRSIIRQAGLTVEDFFEGPLKRPCKILRENPPSGCGPRAKGAYMLYMPIPWFSPGKMRLEPTDDHGRISCECNITPPDDLLSDLPVIFLNYHSGP